MRNVALVARALSGTCIDWDVYLDDILITAPRPCEARAGAQRVATALRDAGFIISPKSELEPATCITFFGKRLDSVRRSISNTVDIFLKQGAGKLLGNTSSQKEGE